MTQQELDRIKGYVAKAKQRNMDGKSMHVITFGPSDLLDFLESAIADLPLLVAEVERLQEQCIIKNRIDKLDELQSALSAAQKEIKRMREALELLNLTSAHSAECTDSKCHPGCEYRIITAALGREGVV